MMCKGMIAADRNVALKMKSHSKEFMYTRRTNNYGPQAGIGAENIFQFKDP